MITKARAGIAVGFATVLVALTSRALAADERCSKCSGADMFKPACPAGTDVISASTVKLGLNFGPECYVPDTTLVFSGAFTVQRAAATAGVINAEITQMVLTAADGTRLVAGEGLGQGGVLQASTGATTQNANANTGHGKFNVFFEVGHGVNYYYNWDPLVVEADITCLPPGEAFTLANPCVPLYLTPPGVGAPRPAQAEANVTLPRDYVLPHDPYPIPAVRGYGLLAMTVLMVTGMGIKFGRRRGARG